MMSVHGSSGNRRWPGSVLLGVLPVILLNGVAGAEDRYYVLPDGRQIPLAKSSSEMAVVLDSVKAAGVCAKRLAGVGRGIIEDLPGAEHSRFKLLRVADTSMARRDLVRQDPAILDVRPVYRMEGSEEPLLSTGTVVVKVRAELSEPERSELWKTYHLEVVEPVEGLNDVYSVKPVDDDDDEVLRAQVLAADPRTVWAQPNFRQRLQRRQFTPADEFFDRQWYLQNSGNLGGVAGADISALDAWLLSEGQDVLIGMFDDACDVDHEDLAANYIGVGHDPTKESTDPEFENPRPKAGGDRHGTAVMGLAVARANSVGIRGVAYLSRFTVSRGESEVLTPQEVASVYTFARQQDVDVHINSWGFTPGTFPPAIVVDAIRTAFEQGRDPDGEEGDDEPLGMVVVFASGNGVSGQGPGIQLESGQDLSTLQTVIGVGASDISDRVTSYSNYGPDLDLLAPGGGVAAGMATVDNDENLVPYDDGYNIGGFTSRLGVPDLDGDGKYTEDFSGTSAACPIVAGVAALILSANPLLTATDVRLIMEHTADRVSPTDANYNNVTGHSLRYGYGRVNAERAALAAIQALSLDSLTWPDRVTSLRVDGSTLRWRAGTGTEEFLIIESPAAFVFENDPDDPFPVEGECYTQEQSFGCDDLQDAELGALPAGVSIAGVVRCDGTCAVGSEQSLAEVVGGGSVAYALYGRNAFGRYSRGVEADVTGSVPGDGDDGGSSQLGPKVTIMASVTEGVSPLTVVFTGNGQRTTADIDDDRTQWDFDIDDGVLIDAGSRNASHTYVVPPGETRTFIARLTMFDVDGNPGAAQVAIRVQGSATGDAGGDLGQSNVRILVGVSGTVDSDVDQGTSPFEVQLSVDASTLAGALQSVFWDLGDGTTATSIVVPHTYVNEADVALRIPITATVTTRSSSGVTQTAVATRIITVLPGTAIEQPETPTLPGAGVQPGNGGSASACGALGMLPLFAGLASIMCLRRRFR
jgi:PKD repeat protein